MLLRRVVKAWGNFGPGCCLYSDRAAVQNSRKLPLGRGAAGLCFAMKLRGTTRIIRCPRVLSEKSTYRHIEALLTA